MWSPAVPYRQDGKTFSSRAIGFQDPESIDVSNERVGVVGCDGCGVTEFRRSENTTRNTNKKLPSFGGSERHHRHCLHRPPRKKSTRRTLEVGKTTLEEDIEVSTMSTERFAPPLCSHPSLQLDSRLLISSLSLA